PDLQYEKGAVLKISKGIMAAAAVTVLAAMLGGCASDLIQVKPGSENVVLADSSQVKGCESKGTITVSVLANVGFVNRSVKDVDANLLQLAKNGAVDAGGDTVVKGPRPDIGKRTFDIYKCRP
ncbi:MAG TPA: DUF4156 domain-containing protein, partial [Burkholderiales bacterium]|nr:DUF4156 domain-containing protein [Burkholderiales bacterium]